MAENKKLTNAKLASGEKQKQKYKVTLHIKQYLKNSGHYGLQKIWIKELI